MFSWKNNNPQKTFVIGLRKIKPQAKDSELWVKDIIFYERNYERW